MSADSEFVFISDLPRPDLPISQSLARRIRFERRCPSYRIGQRVAFKVGDLRAWIESRRADAEPEPLLVGGKQ